MSLGKSAILKLLSNKMEALNSKNTYKYLHLTQVNWTVPLYNRLSKQGKPMANWALDSLIETVQKFYHKMNFHTGKSNGWLRHSAHVMVMSKASQIIMEEYSQINSKEDKDSKFVDHTDSNLKTSKGYKNTKPSSTPKQTRESCAVAEYLLLGRITTEFPGQMYNHNKIWDTVSHCTVGLTTESERERSVQVICKSQTKEEDLLDQFTDNFFSGTNAEGGANNTNSNADNEGDN